MEKMSLGEKLAFLRQERGYAQKEIAPLLNLSISTISNYENGVHSPDLACAALQIFTALPPIICSAEQNTVSRQNP